MEWSSVHELQPRVSTSAGQSVAAAGVDVARVVVVLEGFLIAFAWAAQVENALLEVQDRQLRGCVGKHEPINTQTHTPSLSFTCTHTRVRAHRKSSGSKKVAYVRFSIRSQDDTRRQRF